MLTLVRSPAPLSVAALPADVVLRAPEPDDAVAVGQLYFGAYEPGIAGADESEAIDDIRASFAGEYGASRLDWSWLALSGGTVVGAVLIVERAPWPDTPDCPFIIELFTARNWRRQGVGRALVAACIDAAGGEVALRVNQDNSAARRLYASFGFSEA